MPSSTQARVGLAGILVGAVLFGCAAYWQATRKLMPLDIPASLSRGHLDTARFSVDRGSGYHIQLEIEGSGFPVPDDLECVLWGCNAMQSVLQATWYLSRGGKIEVSGGTEGTNGGSGDLSSVGRVIGCFKSSGSPYTLDVNILSDTAFLNARHPRLRVQADGEAYNRRTDLYVYLSSVAGLLVVIGGALFLVSRSQPNDLDPDRPMLTFLLVACEHFVAQNRCRHTEVEAGGRYGLRSRGTGDQQLAVAGRDREKNGRRNSELARAGWRVTVNIDAASVGGRSDCVDHHIAAKRASRPTDCGSLGSIDAGECRLIQNRESFGHGKAHFERPDIRSTRAGKRVGPGIGGERSGWQMLGVVESLVGHGAVTGRPGKLDRARV